MVSQANSKIFKTGTNSYLEQNKDIFADVERHVPVGFESFLITCSDYVYFLQMAYGYTSLKK